MTTNVELVPLDQIDQDITNHRLIADADSDRQLQESIAANGVQQPIKVSRKPDGRYTLVFGFRRTAAAKAAGLDAIPAIVEQDLDANTIRALQAIENLERRELHPMEEAQFCLDLAGTIQHKPSADDDEGIAEAVAQRIGRSRKWVELRLAMARLSDRVKAAFMAGDIHLQHAQLIARLVDHDAQEEVLGNVRASDCHWLNGRERVESRRPPATIADTRAHVERRLRDLGSVAWKLEARFGDLPDCASCPNNSANRLDLFDGDQPKRPQCLDANCFKEKSKVASRAVVRATNTAIKTAEKVTPKVAAAAIADREVEFIRGPAVVEAAKRRQDPASTGAAQARGQASNDRKWQIDSALKERLDEWGESAFEAIIEKLGEPDPFQLAMISMISKSGISEQADNPWGPTSEAAQAEARAVLTTAIELLLAGSNEAERLEHLALLLGPALKERIGRFNSPFLQLASHPHVVGRSTWLVQTLATMTGVDAGPPPERTTIEAELFPKESKKAAA